MRCILFIILFFGLNLSYSQVGINTITPHSSSMLDIFSINKGLLIPRIALTASNNASPIISPATSLLIYNTATTGAGLTAVTPGYYYWDSSQWLKLNTGTSSSPSWELSGNSGTNATTNFIGTNDNVDVVFKRNGTFSGLINPSNTAFGHYSFNQTTSGVNNTAIGSYNLLNNIAGNRNTAIGNGNLSNNTDGSFNIALGVAVLQANTTGSRNIAMGGFTSLFKNTTGNDNISLGYAAMYNNVNSSYNIAIGNTVLYNSTANNNIAIGNESMYNNTTGTSNVVIGINGMRTNTTGNSNIAIGRDALYSNTIGETNVGIGYGTSYQNTTGGGNTAIGFVSAYSTTSGNSNSSFGAYSLYNNTIGGNNTAIGQFSMRFNTTGFNNTGIGSYALSNVTTGSNNTAIGQFAQVPNATSDNQIRIGDTSISYAGTQVAWSVTSDKRWKKDIQNSNLGLDFITQLRPVSYTRKNDKLNKIEYGFIAQELEKILNESDVINNGIITKDDEGMYSVRYNDLFAPIVKAIQEQQVVIKQQQEENTKLLKAIEILENRLQKIEAKLN